LGTWGPNWTPGEYRAKTGRTSNELDVVAGPSSDGVPLEDGLELEPEPQAVARIATSASGARVRRRRTAPI
jgi:hypothetical protein